MKPIHTSIRRLALVLAALFLCHPLHGIPVRVLAWDTEIAGMRLAIVDSKGSTVIEAMHPSKRTKVYQLTAGEKPLVIEALDRIDPEGKPFRSELKIPEGITQPLLVILPDPKALTGVRLFVLEDNTSNFAWGSTRFINATGRRLVFVQEKKILPLPSSWDPVQTDPGGTTRNMEVKLYYHDQPARAFYSAIWEYNTELRMLVFLVPGEDPRLGPIALKMIPEDRRLLLAAEEASAAANGAQP